MLKEKIEIFKAYCKARINRYFPSVRGAVLLIVVPAFFIVPVYFLTVVKEIIVDKRFSPGAYYEERFAAVRPDLPAHASVNFVSDQHRENGDFLYVRYALVPARLVRDLNPKHDLLVVQYLDTPGIPSFKGYQLLKNYGNGVMLFRRIAK
ncbi:hypothetical protein D1BOALGB6SA_950 [Olavius sp. associated proteobacterium Delta 1]|nr:hypothetical protein D1BOALGB6SA_950 [Olavius sp. associated proteobacterium Delta 1]